MREAGSRARLPARAPRFARLAIASWHPVRPEGGRSRQRGPVWPHGCIATRSWTSPSRKPRGSSRPCHPSGTRSRAPSSDSRATIVASPEWRNWQTRGTQNPVSFGTCGFDPHLRHDQTGPSCTVVRCREIECARHADPTLRGPRSKGGPMSKRLLAVLTVTILGLALGLTACGGGDDNGGDLLSSIEDKGVLTVSTDPAYPPQSELNKDTGRVRGLRHRRRDGDRQAARCRHRLGSARLGDDHLRELGRALGHLGRLDDDHPGARRGSGLHAALLLHARRLSPSTRTTRRSPTSADLDGKKIGACGGCTYDLYLQNKLNIAKDESGEPVKIESVVTDPEIKTYDTDSTAIQDLALGDGRRLDAVVSALPTLQAAIDAGSPIKIVRSGPLLRAAVGRDRQELAARSYEPRRSNLGDHRGDARRRDDGRSFRRSGTAPTSPSLRAR